VSGALKKAIAPTIKTAAKMTIWFFLNMVMSPLYLLLTMTQSSQRFVKNL
jgi:hypothetical protein